MERLTMEYCGEYVPKELCSIDRLGGADDCDLCCEYCKATEEGNEYCRECAINKCFNKLGEYENLEEQGKLLKLPYAEGDLISRHTLSKMICSKEYTIPEFKTEAERNVYLLGLNAKQIAVMECLSDIPAAYDIDKVVELLDTECKHEDVPVYEGDTETDYYIRMEKAVEIVKSGGLNKTGDNKPDNGICEPEYMGENVVIGCRVGKCRCGNFIRSYQKFCDECGVRLDWSNVRVHEKEGIND